MQDPCKTCLVKSCCREVCRTKMLQLNFYQRSLEQLSPYLYTWNGSRQKYIPDDIEKIKIKIIKNIKKIQAQIRHIINHGRGIESEGPM